MTLKRWSQSGKLKAARVDRSGSKPRYRYATVERIVSQAGYVAEGITGPLAQEERPSAQVTLTREDVVRSDRGDELAAIVEDVLERRLASFVVAMEGRFAQVAIADVMQPLVIEGLNKVQGETHAALKSFDHARHSMMNKYDSTDALLRQQNADLREEVRRLREVATSLDAAKVSQRLGEIVETLRDLKPRN